MDTEEIYETQNIPLTAYLVHIGYSYPSLVWRHNKCRFRFIVDSELMANVEEFFASKTRVDPLTYSNEINSIRQMMHDSNPRINRVVTEGNRV